VCVHESIHVYRSFSRDGSRSLFAQRLAFSPLEKARLWRVNGKARTATRAPGDLLPPFVPSKLCAKGSRQSQMPDPFFVMVAVCRLYFNRHERVFVGLHGDVLVVGTAACRARVLMNGGGPSDAWRLRVVFCGAAGSLIYYI
jgi:hypothetical protein